MKKILLNEPLPIKQRAVAVKNFESLSGVVSNNLAKMMKVLGLLLLSFVVSCLAQEAVDCTKPPPFVNPHHCCKDPPPSEIAQKCSTKLGVPLRTDKAPDMEHQQPDIGAITCFAECVLTESKYLNDGKLDMAAIKGDLQRKFATDPDYISVMEAAFSKCGSVAQRQLAAMQNAMPPGSPKRGCSPLSGLILGCSYKEFFENCPASKWTSNAECNAVQAYMKKCSKV
ncbi:unnamed protein product [Hermetia illucens]|uniref:OBP47-like domain-containing protein n=1 Tax=Hermetia illucens TaxID=343691 RepID=A0A7R8UC32_HERIL|nr:general odorant-binding protein 68-like [Hermetia illucens]CAD7078043.1 unnamed protein product [Hermetia illucens]